VGSGLPGATNRIVAESPEPQFWEISEKSKGLVPGGAGGLGVISFAKPSRGLSPDGERDYFSERFPRASFMAPVR